MESHAEAVADPRPAMFTAVAVVALLIMPLASSTWVQVAFGVALFLCGVLALRYLRRDVRRIVIVFVLWLESAMFLLVAGS